MKKFLSLLALTTLLAACGGTSNEGTAGDSSFEESSDEKNLGIDRALLELELVE